jgi:prophage DNA circulation protein
VTTETNESTVTTDEHHDRETCTERNVFRLSIDRSPADSTGPDDVAAIVEIHSHAHGFEELQWISEALHDLIKQVDGALHKRALVGLLGQLRDGIAGVLLLDPEDIEKALDDAIRAENEGAE